MATNEAAVLDALGDPTRRLIVERLAAGPLPVGVLAAMLPVTRPAVSQHLKVLKAAGLLLDHAEGTRRVYRLDPDGLAAIRDYFDRFWQQALASYAATVAAEPAREPTDEPTAESARGPAPEPTQETR